MDEAALFDLMQRIEAGDPDALQAVMDLGIFSDKMGLEGQQSQMGAQMMQTPSAEGQRVGGTYVAANPLEHLSTAMSRILGAKQMGDSRTRMEDLIKRKGQGLTNYARGMAQPPPPAQPAWAGVPFPYPGE